MRVSPAFAAAVRFIATEMHGSGGAAAGGAAADGVAGGGDGACHRAGSGGTNGSGGVAGDGGGRCGHPTGTVGVVVRIELEPLPHTPS